jgi:hypothetical protein
MALPGPPLSLAVPVRRVFRTGAGPDWIAVCRWITVGYGAVCTLGLIAVGLLVQHITVPLHDPSTGLTTVQTFNIGPPFAIAAIVVAVLFAMFAWLTRYTAARVVFLVFDVLALLSAVSQVGVDFHAGGYAIFGLVGVALDIAYGAALVMSLLPRAEPAYG